MYSEYCNIIQMNSTNVIIYVFEIFTLFKINNINPIVKIVKNNTAIKFLQYDFNVFLLLII